ncbi:glycosyltransferase family 2 protein [Lutibacter sp.]|uniref:glycosyltransferase family 2 protein n=1 Tax=Lutibacter sp. TaxID=1925666 RepID=UPI002734878A|nr:glycosyltransferase family 2 protein [Lutibacter sp.]MDP3312577.1 glycosyltransferase family 2 protein [Lutibacter sp.]
MTKLSIITINYNNIEGLKKTIASVVNQTYKEFEYIVIDGGSKDGSEEVISNYKSSIDYAVIEPDSGVYNAMNKGIYKANGSYLLFLNSGDVLYNSDVLAKVVGRLDKEYDFYYGDIVLSGSKKHKSFPSKLSFSFFYIKSLPHQATFIKRTVFDNVFYYNEDLKVNSDWELFSCAICKYNCTYEYLNFIISVMDTNGMSHDPKNQELIKKERTYCLEKHFPLYLEDYKKLFSDVPYFEINRFKMLKELENSFFSKKINSLFLKIQLRLLRNKSVKDL